jgi:tetratricopeptide (TPR) repeat protein
MPRDEAQMNTLDDEARERFELGRTFYEAGRFSQAAEEFAEAYRLSQRPQLLYNLYVAYRDAGKWPEATEALRGYLDKVPDAPDRITLRARLKSMEEQVARQKESDARAEAERKRNEQAQPALEPQRSVVPWVLMGSGGALLVGSVITGVLAGGKASDLDDACENGGKLCPEAQRDDVKSLRTLAVTTDVLWALGAAVAVTGLVLRLTGALDTKAERRVAANVGATRDGFAGALTVRY